MTMTPAPTRVDPARSCAPSATAERAVDRILADDTTLGEFHRTRLRAAASERGVRVETVETDAGTELGRYASLLLSGTYAAEYLGLGLVED